MLRLTNGVIYTLDPRQPIVSSLLIDHGCIVADEAVASGKLPTLDLSGRVVLPGLMDAHLHLEHYALSLQRVDCETATRAECLRRVAARAAQTSQGEWVLGHGWNQNAWPDGFGNPRDLDAITPNHPVFLTAKSLHACWVNGAAMRLAGITAATPDPADGKIDRDERGNPTGLFFETAMELVGHALPEPTVEQISQALQAAQTSLWQMGLTSVQDFDRRRCFAALQNLHQRGRLRLRVTKSIPLEDLSQAIALGLRSGFGDDFLRIGSVKAFADGALGPQTAAMLHPYTGSADNIGILMLDAEQLVEQGREAVANGLSLAVHAIGDRANHEVLAAFEQLRQEESRNSKFEFPIPPLRHRIEHVQLLHHDDFPRLAQLGVIASMQPIHATSDMLIADRYWGERASGSYAWRTLLQHGAMLAFGSDAPVESPNPFWGLHAAVTRQRQDGAPGAEGWRGEQRLSVAEALAGYTSGAAYAAGVEDRLGKLSPGFLADLIVLETDPFTCPPIEIQHIRPSAVMVGGEWVVGKQG